MIIRLITALLAGTILFTAGAEARTPKKKHYRAAPVVEYAPVRVDDRYPQGAGIDMFGKHMGIKPLLPHGLEIGTFPIKQRKQYTSNGGGGLIWAARAHIGQTASELGLRRRLWCAAFMNKITGGGTGSDMARSYASYGSPASPGCVGCIAVLSRGKRGGHVGVVSGYDGRGNPIIISGNHGHRVGEGVYPKGRVIAWRYG